MHAWYLIPCSSLQKGSSYDNFKERATKAGKELTGIHAIKFASIDELVMCFEDLEKEVRCKTTPYDFEKLQIYRRVTGYVREASVKSRQKHKIVIVSIPTSALEMHMKGLGFYKICLIYGLTEVC